MKSPTTLLKEAWGILTGNVQLLITIYLIPAIVSFLFTMKFGSEETAAAMTAADVPLFFIGLIALIIVSLLGGIALIKAISAPESTTVSSAYSFAFKNVLSYLWVAILTSVIIFVGFLLLVIPGIIAAVYLSFAYFIALMEEKRGVDALKQSYNYVKGKWWAVFGRIIVLILVSIVIGFIVGFIAAIVSGGNDTVIAVGTQIMNLFIVPFSVAYIYLMYVDVKNAPAPEQIEVQQSEGEAVS